MVLTGRPGSPRVKDASGKHRFRPNNRERTQQLIFRIKYVQTTDAFTSVGGIHIIH